MVSAQHAKDQNLLDDVTLSQTATVPQTAIVPPLTHITNGPSAPPAARDIPNVSGVPFPLDCPIGLEGFPLDCPIGLEGRHQGLEPLVLPDIPRRTPPTMDAAVPQNNAPEYALGRHPQEANVAPLRRLTSPAPGENPPAPNISLISSHAAEPGSQIENTKPARARVTSPHHSG